MAHQIAKNAKFVIPRIIGARAMSNPVNDGKAGSIRESGDAFGKIEAAREEEYFYKQQQEQLKKLKANQISQADFHKKQIEEHEQALKRHKDALATMKK